MDDKAVKAAEPKSEEATKTPEKPSPTPSPKSKPKSAPSGAALGKVSGTAPGGQILQKEEISNDVLNALKVCENRNLANFLRMISHDLRLCYLAEIPIGGVVVRHCCFT